MSEHPLNQTQVPPPSQDQVLRLNAIRIALVTGILMTAITAVTLPIAFQVGIERIWGSVITAVTALVAFLSAYISSRNRPTLGSGILITTIMALAMGVTFLFANNQGIAIAAIIVFLVSTIATLTLPPQLANRTIAVSVVLGILNILADFYLPNFGLPSDPRYTNIIAVVLSVVYTVFILRQFYRYSLRTKMAISFVLIVLVPVLLLGIQSTVINSNNLKEQANSDLMETARLSAQTIDNFLGTERDAVRTESQVPDLGDFLSLPRSQRAGSVEEVRAYDTLLALQRKNSVFITSYALLDLRGVNVLDTDQAGIGEDLSKQEYFKAVLASGTPHVSPVQISQTTPENYLYFSAPVRNSLGDIVGVVRSKYNSSILQNLLRDSTITPHNEETAVLVDNETYLRLAHTDNRELLYKTYENLNLEQTIRLQEQLRLPFGAPKNIIAAEPEVVEGIQNIVETPIFISPAVEFDGATTYTGGYRLENANWTVLVRRSERSILAPIEVQTRTITLSSLLTLIGAGFAGIVIAQILARSITQLSDAAAEITKGNLDARANVTTQDEIGDLANSFNLMTRQLQDTLGGLERRVAERTADVELARLISERRAQDLQAISEISRTISSEQRLEILLPLISRLVSERFDFYHVGIFFIDKTRQFAVLQASNSEGGRRMIARGHQLEVGQTGIVGNVTQTGRPRIALDVGSDAVYFNNPDLPDTRSEMALPLNVRGQTIGALDVQSTKPGAFSEADANTLGILADQVAIAIDNARLFGQSQDALNQVQKLIRQYQSQEWIEFIRQSPHIGYRQGRIEGKSVETPVDNETIREALDTGKAVVLDETGGHDTQPVMAIPVKLRGQTIGVLNVQAPARKRTWSPEEVNLAQAISDRLALALENARLLQESQRRAVKEQKIGEVTARIGASINMRNVLQTAVEELGRALPGSEVVIQFQHTEEKSS